MENHDKEHDYSFEILHEQVASEDLFEDKTHERLANTLYDKVSKANKGATIGLEGSWGSGKSTVINLLKKKLADSKNEKTLFFVFDAWAHDGDPLRKIFLESLIDSIDPNEKDGKLQQLKNSVSARSKVVSVKTQKTASKLGKLLSFSALFIPVGAGLLSATNFERVVMPWSPNAGLSFSAFFGFLFSFSPLFTMAGWKIFGKKEDGKTKWDIFESQSQENYTQDITEDGERTSIEFESFFNEILTYVFSNNSPCQYDQAVLVIDNLDRVEPDYAQNIWSTLQTFFQHRTSSLKDSDSNWRDNLWFLIPYDRSGIKKIWSDKKDGSETIQTESQNNTQNSEHDVTASFMEKCFQAIIDVPPPVMSAWIDYLKQCVAKAFIGWPQAEKDGFAECFVQCMSKLDSSPTPRKIHSLINRAGMLGQQWKGEFSAESLCLYSIYRDQYTECQLRHELLQDGLPKSFFTYRDIEDIKPEVAGLLFGVSSEKGIQLLLAPEIKAAIRDGKHELLEDLAIKHKEAFWLALRASSAEWMVSESHNDEYRINTIMALGEAFYDQKERVANYINTIVLVFEKSFDHWEISKYSYYSALDVIFRVSTKSPEVIAKFREKLNRKISSVIAKAHEKSVDASELKHLEELTVLFEVYGQPLEKRFHPSLIHNKWDMWRQACRNSDTEFKMVLPNKELFQELVENAGFDSNSLNKDRFSLLAETYALHSSHSSWGTLVESLVTWFNLSGREYSFDDVYLLALKLLGNASETDSDSIKKCVKDADFWVSAQNADIEECPTLPYLVACSDPDFRSNDSVGENVKLFFDQDFSSIELAEAYQFFKIAKCEEDIWQLARHDRNKFAVQIIRDSEEDDFFKFGAMYVDEIAWSDEDELSRIVNKLCKNGSVHDIKEDIQRKVQTYNEVVYILSKHGDSDSKNFVENLLENLPRADWAKALQKHNALLKCIPNNCTNFSKAWCDHLIKFAKSELNQQELGNIEEVIELKCKVLDLNEIALPNIARAYFNKEENDPLDAGAFNAISKLIEPVMRTVTQRSYEIRLSYWLENNQEERIQWLISSDIELHEDALDQVKAQVASKLRSLKSPARDLYEELNDRLKLGLTIPEPELEQPSNALEVTENE